MRTHLMKELETLKRDVLTMGAAVEEAISNAIQALRDRDRELAEEVRARESGVNAMEVEIEEECLRILALHRPVAMDLRLVVSVFKINNDLERIGDIATHIARRAMILAELPPVLLPADFGPMAERAQRMLHQALDALVKGDNRLASQVCADDSVVDEYHKKMSAIIEAQMRAQPEGVHRLAQCLAISRHLERIADLARIPRKK